MTSQFQPLGHVLDYKLEPVYSVYGLRHGKFNGVGGVDSVRYRTAVMLGPNRIDFVNKWNDTVFLRLTKIQFAKLVKMWTEIQTHGKNTAYSFNPVLRREFAEGEIAFSVTANNYGGTWYPRLQLEGGDRNSTMHMLKISQAEIALNSTEDMMEILTEYVQLEKDGWPESKIHTDMELGVGNPKAEHKPQVQVVAPGFGRGMMGQNPSTSNSYQQPRQALPAPTPQDKEEIRDAMKQMLFEGDDDDDGEDPAPAIFQGELDSDEDGDEQATMKKLKTRLADMTKKGKASGRRGQQTPKSTKRPRTVNIKEAHKEGKKKGGKTGVVFLSDQGSDTDVLPESPVKKAKSTPDDLSDLSDQENVKRAKRSTHSKRAAGGRGEDE